MRAPIAQVFSILPHVLVEQAFHCDFAPFPTPDGEVMLAFWVRYAKVEAEDGVLMTGDGKAFGIEIVAYPCDLTGRVFDWERRYEVTHSCDACAALTKLKMLMANDLAPLHNYEGLLEELESDWSGRLDWDEMPQHLQ